MKKILIIVALHVSYFSYAQFFTPYHNVTGTANPESGNVGIGEVSPQAKLSVLEDGGLGVEAGSFKLLSRFAMIGNVNHFMINKWLIRDAFGNNWLTTRVHDGVSIDVSFHTPGVDTRTWWERDPYNNIQSWGDASQTYMTINQGNVGIGVNPSHKLHVQAGDASSSALRLEAGKFSMGGTSKFEVDAVGIVGGRLLISENGNIGLGTITPDAKLDVYAHSQNADNLILSANYSEQYRWRFRTIDRGNAIDLDITASDASDTQESVLKLSRTTSGRPEFAINENWLVANNGNVGIGTTTPNSKLTVDGKVNCEEVKVEVIAGTGPDYVFEPSYNLPTLAETEAYIKANKHLPEMPSAKEMEANGIHLSEMNMLLLKKVEELTLHLIEQQKEIERLSKRVAEFERK